MNSRLLLLPFALFAAPVIAQNPVIYSTDFETDDGGFQSTVGTEWEYGVPTSGPGAAHSGTKLWATNLAGPPQSGTHWVTLL